MILKFLKTYLEENDTFLNCPYTPLKTSRTPTKIYLEKIPTNAANNVISLHEVQSTSQRPTFWDAKNPSGIRSSNIIMYIRSKMSSDTTTTPLSDGDYDNILQTAEALRDLIDRISMVDYSDQNGKYVINQVRPIMNVNFDHEDAQGRNLYMVRFEATWNWNSAV